MPFTLDDYGAYSSQKQYTCQFPSSIAIHAEGRGPQKVGGFIVLGPIFFLIVSKIIERLAEFCVQFFFYTNERSQGRN